MLVRVTDPILLEGLVRRASEVVSPDHSDFNSTWRSNHLAVPEESGLHLDDDQARRLVEAFRSVGVDRLWAIETEDRGCGFLAFGLGVTAEELGEVSLEFSGSSFLLVAEDGDRAVVLCTIEDYIVIGGVAQFVLAAVDDLEVAEQDFLEYTANHFEVAKPSLIAVAEHFAAARALLNSAPE